MTFKYRSQIKYAESNIFNSVLYCSEKGNNGFCIPIQTISVRFHYMVLDLYEKVFIKI